MIFFNFFLADARDKGGCFLKLKKIMGLNKKILKGYFEITNSAPSAESAETLSLSDKYIRNLSENGSENSKKKFFLIIFFRGKIS